MPTISPTLPVVGGSRGTQELAELATLTTIRDTINGLVDGFNLSGAALDQKYPIHEMAGTLNNASGLNERVFSEDGTELNPASSVAKVPFLVIPSTSPWGVAGKTTYMMLQSAVGANSIDPGGIELDLVSISIALKPITAIGGTAGAITYTLGTQVSSVSQYMLPDRWQVKLGSAFVVPAAGAYVLTAKAAPQFNLAIAAGAVAMFHARVLVFQST